MNTVEVIRQDLEAVVQEVTDVGLTDISLSRAEVMQLITRFYGTVILATQYMVITPEEAHLLHVWIVNLLDLN